MFSAADALKSFGLMGIKLRDPLGRQHFANPPVDRFGQRLKAALARRLPVDGRDRRVRLSP